MLISSSTAVHTRKLSRSRSSSSSSQSREAASPTRCSLTKRSARKDLNGGRDEATALLAPCSRTQDSTLRGEYRYALMTHESYAQQQDGYTAVRACQVLTSSKSNPQPIELTAATYCRAAGRVCQSTAVAYYWREGNSKKKRGRAKFDTFGEHRDLQAVASFGIPLTKRHLRSKHARRLVRLGNGEKATLPL